jgi:hypothetical protein
MRICALVYNSEKAPNPSSVTGRNDMIRKFVLGATAIGALF